MQPESSTITAASDREVTAATRAWCADWTDPRAYPASDAGASVIGWEFLRRSEQYTDSFQELVALAARGGTDAELAVLHDGLARRWGLLAMVDPSRSGPPRWRTTSTRRVDDDEASDQFISIALDVSKPLRPQLANIRAFATNSALAWCKAHSEDIPIARRVGKEKNPAFYVECRH